MKREIKFRAWDKVVYLMIPYNEMTGGRTAWGRRTTLADVLQNKDYEIMQFTGLLDKNGKEIYEGDIVRWDDGSNGEKWRVAEVLINPDIQFKIVRIKCDFVQSAKEGHLFRFGNFIYSDTENHLEIIGNIYENPELLNNKG